LLLSVISGEQQSRALPTKLGVLYPGVQAACVHGLTDLFGIAVGISLDQQRDGRSRFALRIGNQRITAIPTFRAYMTAIRAGGHSRGS
jgi:hypothetical protein